MANVDSPFGLKPVRYLNGVNWNGQATLYNVASDYATALYIGDPVILTGTTEATGMYPQVQKATLAATNYTIGPIVAVQENPAASLERVYIPASTGGYVWVADDPMIIFEVQCDSATNIAAADFGGNGILVQTHAGNTITGLSGIELDESSVAVTNNGTEMIFVMKLANKPNNELGQHAVVECMISLHKYAHTTAGITGV